MKNNHHSLYFRWIAEKEREINNKMLTKFYE